MIKITILNGYLYKLEEKLNKFQKKFNKYGYGTITYNVGESYINEEKGTNLYHRKVVDIEIEGSYQIKGYEFIAKLEFEPQLNKNIIKGDMNKTIPIKFLTRCECDHCKSDRFRKHTILLRKGNEYVQVGSSCVKDYLGVDITDYASYLSFISEIGNVVKEYNDDFIQCRHCPNYYEVNEVLEQALVYTKQNGYVSKKMVDENGGIPTSRIIIAMFNKEKNLTTGELLYPKAENISHEIKEEVKQIIEFTNSLNDTNTYYYNLKTLLELDYVEDKDLPLLVSVVGNYLRETVKREEQAKKVPSEYVGKVGDKIEFDSKIKVLTSYRTEWGTTYIYEFKIEDNILIWKTTNYDFDLNKIYHIKGTIKEHKEFNGIRQTVLTRCKFICLTSNEIIENKELIDTECNKVIDKYFELIKQM